MDNSKIDKLFREKLSTHESQPTNQAWEDLNSMLDNKQNKNKKTVYMVAAAIVFMILSSISFYFFNNENNVSEQPSLANSNEVIKPEEITQPDNIITPDETESLELIAKNTDEAKQPVDEQKLEVIDDEKTEYKVAKAEPIKNQHLNKNISKTENDNSKEIPEVLSEISPTEEIIAANIESEQPKEGFEDLQASVESVTISFPKVAANTRSSETTESIESTWGNDSVIESLTADSKVSKEGKKIFNSLKSTTNQLFAFNGKNKNKETE
ncbi:hypothetical protein [Marinigracilibium pacificum]|uniref:Uncharacterized protein n=1 Tax=Marinigracilibium pacificum TaxID=2729599 RepID=A0A848J122_9BACT|nr:hypothetical protein [Marinigracilibium pacificum]NMM49371.1 hypothetical protein [Marinigracilibium pacificum]